MGWRGWGESGLDSLHADTPHEKEVHGCVQKLWAIEEVDSYEICTAYEVANAVAIDKTNLFQAFLCFLTFGSEIKFIEVPTHGGNFVCRKIGYDGYKKKT